jgi:Ca2+/H+ antiporter
LGDEGEHQAHEEFRRVESPPSATVLLLATVGVAIVSEFLIGAVEATALPWAD